MIANDCEIAQIKVALNNLLSINAEVTKKINELNNWLSSIETKNNTTEQKRIYGVRATEADQFTNNQRVYITFVLYNAKGQTIGNENYVGVILGKTPQGTFYYVKSSKTNEVKLVPVDCIKNLTNGAYSGNT
jgi:hypothetical protein